MMDGRSNDQFPMTVTSNGIAGGTNPPPRPTNGTVNGSHSKSNGTTLTNGAVTNGQLTNGTSSTTSSSPEHHSFQSSNSQESSKDASQGPTSKLEVGEHFLVQRSDTSWRKY